MSDPDTRLAALEAARPRWMAGGEAAPAGVLAQGHQGREAQLRLLAEAGQMRQICLRPVPPVLVPVPPLPPAPLPYLPDPLRPLFRRVLRGLPDRAGTGALMALLAARGAMAHPFDWLPPRDLDGYPPAYAALADWAAGQSPAPAEALSDATWDEFTPALRLAAFARLRGADPAAARELLLARASGVPAEERLRLVAALAAGLAQADAPGLETLLSDRSGKVQEAARGLLARLGHGGDADEAAELAAFFETRKALLSRRVTLAPRTRLNEAQRRRMQELFARVPVAGLAGALGMEETALAAAWPAEDGDLAAALLDALVLSGSGAGLGAFWSRLRDQASEAELARIAPRLSPADLWAEARHLLDRGRVGDPLALAGLLGPAMPEALGQALLAAPPVAGLLAAEPGPALVRLLAGLGLVLPPGAARALRARAAAFSPHDPALDPLALNIALAPTEGPPR